MHTVYLDAFYMDKYPVTIKRYTEFLNATDYREPDWDNSIDETKANYNNNVWNGRVKGEGRHGTTMPVGSYPPNGYGLYDMAGNVWEWCLDEYEEQFYLDSPERNPEAGGNSVTELVESCEHVRTLRVLRGGSWGIALYNDFVELAARFYFYPTYSNVYTGFRCVKPLE